MPELIRWSWVVEHLDEIAGRTVQHLQIAVIAVAVGFAISFVVAVLTLRRTRIYAAATGISGVLYTVPSIAAFAALAPITGLTQLTVLIPLVAYTLLILIRNISAGLAGVPLDVMEAANGMGYGRLRRLFAVELPLAIPLIVAGLRIAAVSTIGLVTIGSVIGNSFGGLGVYINEGLQQFFFTKVYVGAGLSVILALVIDLGFVLLQRLITPWARAKSAPGAAGAGA